MNKDIKMADVFEKPPYTGVDRPEYILKNGKAFNIYGAFNYIQGQQSEIFTLTAENKALRECLTIVAGLLEDNHKVMTGNTSKNFHKAVDQILGQMNKAMDLNFQALNTVRAALNKGTSK